MSRDPEPGGDLGLGGTSAAPSGTGRGPRRWWLVLAAGGAALLLVGVLGWVAAQRPVGEVPESGSTTSTSPEASPSPSESEATAQPSLEPTSAPTGTGQPGPAPGTLPTAAPVPLDDDADFGTGVVAALASVESLEAQAVGPGEVSGPALSFVVRITNDSAEAIDLGRVTVNLSDAQGVPGIAMIGPPAAALEGMLAPGASATGTYVFTIPEGNRAPVRLEVAYSTQAPVVVFTGDTAGR